jgi:hypothetical protein
MSPHTPGAPAHTIEDFEDVIVGRLKAGFPTLKVEPFPDRPEDYRFTHPTGALLVHYRGADFGESQAVGTVSLNRKMTFDVTVYAKSLRSHRGTQGEGGALLILDALRPYLTGWKPKGATSGIVPEREDFLNRDASAWIYVARYSFRAPLVQKTEEQTAALLKRITSLSEQNGHVIRDIQKPTPEEGA